MATMQKMRLADANLNIKIRELLSNFGFGVDRFDVIDSYPSIREEASTLKAPTVVVTTNTLFGKDIELGSSQWPNTTFALDVYAQTDGQRDDITYYLYNNLNDKLFTFYDFNDGFPDLTTAVSYSGITTFGDYYVEGVNAVAVAPPENSVWDGENHHQLIFGIIRMTNG